MSIEVAFPYAGGKTRAASRILPHIPKTFSEYREPFAGAGTIALNLMRRQPNARYWLNDLFPPVYCLWKNFRDRPDEMIRWLFHRRDDLGQEGLFEFAKTTIKTSDEFEMGCKFFVLHKQTWGATGPSRGSGFQKDLTDLAIFKIRDTADLLQSVNLTLSNSDYTNCIGKGKETFVFFDPPYDIEFDHLYGWNGELHRKFNHLEFAVNVKGCRFDWLITYNDNRNIRRLYADYNMAPLNFQYGLRQAQAGELMISNFESPLL